MEEEILSKGLKYLLDWCVRLKITLLNGLSSLIFKKNESVYVIY